MASSDKRGCTPARLAISWFAIVATAAARVHAATPVVSANSDLTFTPAVLTVYQHAQVTFENAGGLHNVRADNNSFWCADDCSLHRAPSSDAWQDTVTFNALGSFGYYCEQHGNTTGGMRGTIVVIDRVFVAGFEPPS